MRDANSVFEVPRHAHTSHSDSEAARPATQRATAMPPQALQEGRRRLVFAETNMNMHSSRSHAVCQLSVERPPRASRCRGVHCSVRMQGDYCACRMPLSAEPSTHSLKVSLRQGNVPARCSALLLC